METPAKRVHESKPAQVGKEQPLPDLNPAAVSFEEVLDQEIDQIGASRRVRRVAQPTPQRDAIRQEQEKGQEKENGFARAHAARLAGLSFSGGGIRSATFNLGIMQGLAEAGVLRRFDYLSTVSGGGYIGSWLAGCVRNGKGAKESDLPKVERVFSPNDDKKSQSGSGEPHSIGFLREYSNYLTPRLGFLSGDTWAFIAAYVRNLSLNLTILISSFTAVMLLPWIVDFLMRLIRIRANDPTHEHRLIALAILIFIVAIVFIGKNLATCGPGNTRPRWFTNKIAVNATIVAPLFLACWLFSAWIYCFYWDHAIGDHATVRSVTFWIRSVAVLTVFCWLSGVLFVWALSDEEQRPQYTDKFPRFFWQLVSVVLSGIVGGVLLHRIDEIAAGWSKQQFSLALDMINAGPFMSMVDDISMSMSPVSAHGTWWLGAFVPPAVIGVILVMLVIQIGITGKYFSEEVREWLGRLGGYLALSSLMWLGLYLLAMPWLGEHLTNNFSKYGSGLMTWILSTAMGLASAGDKKDSKKQNFVKAIFVRVAPYVFVVGLLALISIAITRVHLYFMRQANPLLPSDAIPVPTIYDVYACVAFAIVAVFLSNRVDINLFSMHLLYRNRLVRCYLGASHSDRCPQPFTGFDPDDDFYLSELTPARGYEGPYPIINSTLNLVHGEELAWQQRKGESFIFTPLYSGFNMECGEKTAHTSSHLARYAYRPTAQYGYRGGPLIGTATAISGAAVSPNMGYNSSPAVTFLFTVFNIRLGWWMGNPRHEWSWRQSTPWFGVMYLVNELLGNTSDRSGFVYLSDGGHFENLGIYELVRRRCNLIVACDGGEDHLFQFESLAAVIEKCRTDFGVEIQMGNLAEIKPAGDSPYSQSYYAFGTIRYDAGHSGTLIYVKSTLVGSESIELASYKSMHPAFPNEPTADQWFTELQFESYRQLGYAISQKLTKDARLSAALDAPKSAAVSA